MGTRPPVFWAPSCRVTAASGTASAAAPRERRRGCSPKEMRAVGAPWAAGGRSADSAMVVSGGLPLPRLIDPKASGMREAAPSPSKSQRARTFSRNAEMENPMTMTPTMATPMSRMAEMAGPKSVSPTQASAAPT